MNVFHCWPLPSHHLRIHSVHSEVKSQDILNHAAWALAYILMCYHLNTVVVKVQNLQWVSQDFLCYPDTNNCSLSISFCALQPNWGFARWAVGPSGSVSPSARLWVELSPQLFRRLNCILLPPPVRDLLHARFCLCVCVSVCGKIWTLLYVLLILLECRNNSPELGHPVKSILAEKEGVEVRWACPSYTQENLCSHFSFAPRHVCTVTVQLHSVCFTLLQQWLFPLLIVGEW